MQKIKIRDDYIKLGQALKLAGLVGSGVEAKIVIQDGQVKVNGQVETQRGKKLVVHAVLKPIFNNISTYVRLLCVKVYDIPVLASLVGFCRGRQEDRL